MISIVELFIRERALAKLKLETKRTSPNRLHASATLMGLKSVKLTSPGAAFESKRGCPGCRRLDDNSLHYHAVLMAYFDFQLRCGIRVAPEP